MTKAQFRLLSHVGGAGAVLLLGNAIFVRLNERTIRELAATPGTGTAVLTGGAGRNPPAIFTNTNAT